MPLDSLPSEFLFTITAQTAEKPPVMIPSGPAGTRVIVTAMNGTFEGPKLKGKVADAAGGDWVTVRADGIMSLDVRLCLLTDDGASIYMTYTGLGRREADGSMMIRTVPRFETGDERYSWLNSVQAVSHGTTTPGSVTYDVYGLL
jgi:Protein of unknown function (DUF3237)